MDNTSLQRLQETELQILKTFRRVCEENGLRYFLFAGTLLGGVRHQGFIPWDDDVDVMMPMEDYLRFIEIGQRELGDRFFLQTHRTDPNFYAPFAKIRLNHTTLKLSTYKDWHIHSGIDIDIFPLVNVKKSQIKKKQRILKICVALQMQDFIDCNPKELHAKFGKVFFYLLKILYAVIPLKLRVSLYDHLIRRHFSKNDDADFCTVLDGTGLSLLFPKWIIEDSVPIDYCGDKFCAPKHYDELLRIHYGDYMKLPPESERRTCHGDILDFEHSYCELVSMRADK